MTRLRIFGSLALGLSFVLPAVASAAPPLSRARFFNFDASVESEGGSSLNISLALHRDGLSVHDLTEGGVDAGRRIVRSTAPPGELAAFRKALTDNQVGRQISCRLMGTEPHNVGYTFSWIRADGELLAFRAASRFLGLSPCPASVSRLIAASLAFVSAQESRVGAVRVDIADPEAPIVSEPRVAAAGSDRRLLVKASIFENDTLVEQSDIVGAYVFRDGLVVASLIAGDNRFSRIEYTRGQATPAELAELTFILASGRVGQFKSCSLDFNGSLEIEDSYAWAGLGTRTNQFLASTESTAAECPNTLDSFNDSIATTEVRVRSHPDSWVVSFFRGE